MKNFFFNSIQLFSSKLKVGLVFLFGLMMYACADKEYEVPKDEIVGVENRELPSCEFYICDGYLPPVPWDTYTETLGIRGCEVYVSYEYRQCSKGFEFRNFSFTPNYSDPDCMTILDSIANFWLAEDFEEARDMYNNWFRELTLMVQANKLPTLNPMDFNTENTLTYQFIEVDCQTLCVDVYIDEYDNLSIGYIGLTKCGESCCVRVGQWRFDLNGDAFIIGQGVEPETEGCEPTTINCSGDYDPEMCSPACDRL